MSTTTRLTFLYPHLFRTARGEAAATHHVPRRSNSSTVASPRRRSSNAVNAPASFSTSARARQAHLSKRHGKAVEPLPPHQVSKKTPTTPPLPAASATATPTATVATEPQASEPGSNKAEEKETKEDVVNEESKTQNASAAPGKAEAESGAEAETRTEVASNAKDGDAQAADETRSSEPTDSSTLTPEDSTAAAATTTTTVPPELQELNKDKKNTSGPMDSILHMGPPEEAAHRPPHLTPPPYVHHFDSYSLVKQLGSGGYTQAQAITAMKGVRGILAHHLDVAQEGLVSKSDVENETYLFRAACSELSAEVRNNRRVADEGMRQQRTLLQHEVDILTQTLNQELLTLNDNVRGMFNDRRMAVREEQKAAESAIQQISYKISVRLNSETKSEIEQLRWVLIRRSVVGIIFMAVLTLGTLRYASYLSHERQKEAERAAKDAEMARKFDGRHDHLQAPDAVEILSAN